MHSMVTPTAIDSTRTNQRHIDNSVDFIRIRLNTKRTRGEVMKRFFPAIACCLGAVAACSLSGCTAAVPYAISAAQIVTGGTPTPTQYGGPLVQQGAFPPQTAQTDDSKERAEAAALPYRLIAQKNTTKPFLCYETRPTRTMLKHKARSG